MLITSNRAVGEWGSVFGDPVVATAILDRLLHHSHVITIRGDSYRLREKRRSGRLQKPAAAPETETAGRTKNALWSAVTGALDAFSPTECVNMFTDTGYELE